MKELSIKTTLDKVSWSNGPNIGYVANVKAANAGVGSYENCSVYRVELTNIYGKICPLAFATPHGKEPHKILKDFVELNNDRYKKSTGQKYWCEFEMFETERTHLMMVKSIRRLPDGEQDYVENLSRISRGVKKDLLN